MNKTYLASGFPALVLAAGLVSCAPDKNKVQDSFKAQAPKIQKSGQAIELQSFTAQGKRELDLRDRFVLNQADLRKVEVKSSCRMGERDLYHFYEQKDGADFPLHRVLPEEIVLVDLTATPVSCGFEITLFNAVGSRHIFPLASSTISEVVAAPVTLESQGSTVQSFTVGQSSRVVIRWNNPDVAQAQLRCQDATFSALPFHKVLDLGDFNFKEPALRQPKQTDALARQPAQLCRLMFSQANKVAEVSPLFHLLLPIDDLQVQATEPKAQLPTSARVGNARRESQNFFNGASAPTATVTLQNPHPVRRKVRVTGPQLDAQFISLFVNTKHGHIAVPRTRPVSLKLQNSQNALVHTFSNHWLVELEPGGHATWTVANPNPQRRSYGLSCTKEPDAVQIQIQTPVRFELLSENGLLVRQTEFRFKDIFLLFKDGPTAHTPFRLGVQCPD